MREQDLKTVDINGDERIRAHRSILARKKMLRDVFHENFKLMKSLSSKHLNNDGTSLELGSGATSIKSVLPNVITSDVVHSEFNDRRIDAMDMDISDNDLSVIYAQNVFHHIPAPEKSLSEPDRIQKQGGGIILIEPFCGALAAFIYSKFITEEIFDKKQVGWSSDHKGPMLGENQALSYIVFKRDRDIFEKSSRSSRLWKRPCYRIIYALHSLRRAQFQATYSKRSGNCSFCS